MGHNHTNEQGNVGRMVFALLFNLLFAIVQFIGSFWFNSTALLANALHDFGDSLSLVFAVCMQKFSQKKKDKTFSYGYKRFSTLAALINSIILIVGAVLVLSIAVPRLLHPVSPNSKGMLLFAIMGIVINLLVVYFLSKGKSLNEKVMSWHIIDDVLGWSAILIVSIVTLITKVPILDPLLTIVLTAYLLYNVFKLLKESSKIFLQAIPESFDVDFVEKELRSIKGVTDVHDTHAWSLDGEHIIYTTHIVTKLQNQKSISRIKKKVRDILLRHNAEHVTIELEDDCEDCNKC